MYDELVKQLKANIERVAEIDAMAEVTEELTAEQDSLIGAQPGLKAKIERAKEQVEIGNFVNDAEANPPVEKRIAAATQIASPSPNIIDATKIPATAKRSISTLKAFSGQDAELKAYRFGQYFMATTGMQSAVNYCLNTGMPMAVHNEGTNTQGGYLVPHEFGTDLIRLVEKYGVFRQNTNIIPMSSETRSDPRETGSILTYFTGESEAATESTMSWDDVELVAKKLTALTRVTNELNADSAINIGDQIMRSIAYAYALKEDQCGFNGDGTSTYGGITGVRQSLDDAAGNPTSADAGGVVIADGNAYSEITLNNLEDVIAVLPEYADMDAKWYVSRKFYHGVMTPLITAAGGNTIVTLQNGARQLEFLGYPVVLSQVMPKTEANSQICALFGDLAMASRMGDRETRTIATSEHATIGGESVFERGQLAIRATERFDINVHDVGDTSDAGPITGLKTAAS